MFRKLYFLLLIFLVTPIIGFSQHIYDGNPGDSIMVRFDTGTIAHFFPDTSATPLWQIGHGHKAFFGADTAAITMMTDTTLPYPVNANNSFVIKAAYGFNFIVDFWHKYETDTAHAGGIVEFSRDKGVTWQNIKGDCNADSGSFFGIGVLTSNFYTFNDTLQTGEPAFTGVKDTVQYSRFQFFVGYPQKLTETKSCNLYTDTMYIRFRFVSDTTVDTLAGWEIDSIKIEHDLYGGGLVRDARNNNTFKVYPNPSSTGLFNFPRLDNETDYLLEVYDAIGRRILQQPYSHVVDISQYPKGLYFYRISDGTEYYSGQLQVE